MLHTATGIGNIIKLFVEWLLECNRFSSIHLSVWKREVKLKLTQRRSVGGLAIYDLLCLAVVGLALIVGFKRSLDRQILYILRLFLTFLFAGRYCVQFSVMLSEAGILKADNYAMFLLVGFMLTFLILWIVFGWLEKKLILPLIRDQKTNRTLGAAVYGFEVFVFGIFLSVVVMQIGWPKALMGPSLQASWTYPRAHSFMMRTLNVKQVGELIQGNITGGSKDIMLNVIAR